MGRTSVAALWVAVFCGYVALGATIQVLPGYVTGALGGTLTAAGLAVGIAFAATALTRPVAGWLADGAHSRPVVATGGVLTALGGAGHLLATTIPEILLARVVMGAGEAALFSAALPWVLSSIRADRKGAMAGWFGLSMWGGLAVGPVVGSAISDATGLARSVWWTVTALGIVSLIFAVSVRAGQTPSPARPSFTLRGLLPRGASAPGAVFGLSAYGYGAINAIIVLYLANLGSGASHYVLGVFAAAFLITRFFGSPLVTRWGGKRVWGAMLAVETVGLAIIAIPSGGVVGIVAGTALAAVGVSLMFPATVAVTLDRAGPKAPGTSVAVMASFWDLGLMVAGPLSGAVASRFDYPSAFALAAAVSFAALLASAAVRSTAKHEVHQPATHESGGRQ